MCKFISLGLLTVGLVSPAVLGNTTDPWAVRVVEEMVVLLGDESPEVREAALDALHWLAHLAPDRALPGLTLFARQGDPGLRELARKLLYRLSPPTTPYERVVAILLKPERDPHLLAEALASLANEVGNRQLLSTLEKALHEGFSAERSAAILCLAELAKRWEEALHVLGKALLADEIPCGFRQEILHAFENFPDLAPLVPELLKALAKFSRPPYAGSPCESALVRQILRIFASFGEGAVPPLVEALESPFGAHRRAALEVLAHLGEKARAATSAVLALCEKELLPEVRQAALRALGTVGRDDPRALSVLVRAARSRDPQEVAVALEALAQFGAADQEALGAVLLRVNHPMASVRNAALRALGRLAPAEVAVPSLLAALNDPSAAVRRTAALLLGDLGPQAAAAPALVGLLEDPDPLVREAAATALGNLADSSEPVIAGLCGRLKDTSFEVRIAAITALGKLGPKAEAALPDLFWLLESEDEALTYTQQKRLQEAVEETLGKIGLGAYINLLQQLPEEDHAALANAMERAAHRALEWGLRQATRELVDPLSWFARALGIETYLTFKLSPELDVEIKEIIWFGPETEAVLAALGALSKRPRIGQIWCADLDNLRRAVHHPLPTPRILGLMLAITCREGFAERSAWFSAATADPVGIVRLLGWLGLLSRGGERLPWEQGLKDEHPLVRSLTVLGAGRAPVDSNWKEAVLLSALSDSEILVRWSAALGLFKLERLPEGAVPLLLQMLEEEHRGLQRLAGAALARAQRAEAVPKILRLAIEDPLDLAPIAALASYGETLLPLLTELLVHPSSEHRLVAEYTLLFILGFRALSDDGIERIWNSLLDAVRHENPGVRGSAVDLISFLVRRKKELAETAQNVLAQLLEHEADEDVRFEALFQLAWLQDVLPIETLASRFMPILLKIWEMGPEGHRCMISSVWERWGPWAAPAAPALFAYLIAPHEDYYCKGKARAALMAIGEAAVPHALAALEDPGSRMMAVQLLKDLGPKAKNAVPFLLPLLKTEDKELKIAVIQALQRILGG